MNDARLSRSSLPGRSLLLLLANMVVVGWTLSCCLNDLGLIFLWRNNFFFDFSLLQLLNELSGLRFIHFLYWLTWLLLSLLVLIPNEFDLGELDLLGSSCSRSCVWHTLAGQRLRLLLVVGVVVRLLRSLFLCHVGLALFLPVIIWLWVLDFRCAHCVLMVISHHEVLLSRPLILCAPRVACDLVAFLVNGHGRCSLSV